MWSICQPFNDQLFQDIPGSNLASKYVLNSSMVHPRSLTAEPDFWPFLRALKVRLRRQLASFAFKLVRIRLEPTTLALAAQTAQRVRPDLDGSPHWTHRPRFLRLARRAAL